MPGCCPFLFSLPTPYLWQSENHNRNSCGPQNWPDRSLEPSVMHFQCSCQMPTNVFCCLNNYSTCVCMARLALKGKNHSWLLSNSHVPKTIDTSYEDCYLHVVKENRDWLHQCPPVIKGKSQGLNTNCESLCTKHCDGHETLPHFSAEQLTVTVSWMLTGCARDVGQRQPVLLTAPGVPEYRHLPELVP